MQAASFSNMLSRDNIRIEAKISGTENSKDSAKDKLHVNYIIEVTAVGCDVTWTVRRRFKTFETLHEKL